MPARINDVMHMSELLSILVSHDPDKCNSGYSVLSYSKSPTSFFISHPCIGCITSTPYITFNHHLQPFPCPRSETLVSSTYQRATNSVTLALIQVQLSQAFVEPLIASAYLLAPWICSPSNGHTTSRRRNRSLSIPPAHTTHASAGLRT